MVYLVSHAGAAPATRSYMHGYHRISSTWVSLGRAADKTSARLRAHSGVNPVVPTVGSKQMYTARSDHRPCR